MSHLELCEIVKKKLTLSKELWMDIGLLGFRYIGAMLVRWIRLNFHYLNLPFSQSHVSDLHH